MLLLGIDLGTSSIKVSVIEADNQKVIATAKYPDTENEIISIQRGWAEQSPNQWWEDVQEAIKKINYLYDEGNKIIFMTARGSVSKRDWTQFTVDQLKSWGVKYHELIMNKKPHADFFIDDKAINAEDWRLGLGNK